MKKSIITIALALVAFASWGQVPDTSINIKSTNNELYKINALYQVASQHLLKSDMPVNQYVEFQKQFQTLLAAWFKQKEDQDKANKKPETKQK